MHLYLFFAFVVFGPHAPLRPLFPLFHSSPPCLTRSSLLSRLLSSPLLFLFPIRSLMLVLSWQTDPCTGDRRGGPHELSITRQEPIRGENFFFPFHHVLQRNRGGRRRADRHGEALYFPLPLCVCVREREIGGT